MLHNADDVAARDWDDTHNPTTATRRLRRLLADVVVAADRLQERWSEASDEVRRQLWQRLSGSTSAAEDEVYPLRSQGRYGIPTCGYCGGEYGEHLAECPAHIDGQES